MPNRFLDKRYQGCALRKDYATLTRGRLQIRSRHPNCHQAQRQQRLSKPKLQLCPWDRNRFTRRTYLQDPLKPYRSHAKATRRHIQSGMVCWAETRMAGTNLPGMTLRIFAASFWQRDMNRFLIAEKLLEVYLMGDEKDSEVQDFGPGQPYPGPEKPK